MVNVLRVLSNLILRKKKTSTSESTFISNLHKEIEAQRSQILAHENTAEKWQRGM